MKKSRKIISLFAAVALLCLIIFVIFTSVNADGSGVTWDPNNKGANVTLSNNNLTYSCSPSGSGYNSAKATVGKSSGKWYWEVTVNTGTYCMIGIGNSTASVNAYPGGNGDSMAYNQSTGAFWPLGGSSFGSGGTYGIGDVIGLALDLDNHTLTFYKNGVEKGGFTNLSSSETFYPMVGPGDNGTHTMTANFGATSFSYTPPTGFTAYDLTSTPAPSPTNGVRVAWDPINKGSNVTLTNNNLIYWCNPNGSGYSSVKATVGKSSGKWYWEVTVNAGTFCFIGIGNSTANIDHYPGYDSNSLAYGQYNGQLYGGSSFGSGGTYGIWDVIGLALDLDNHTLTFYQNGVQKGGFTNLSSSDTFYPMVGTGTNGTHAMTANFGATPFSYTPPTGFVPYEPTPTQTSTPEPTSTTTPEPSPTPVFSGNRAILEITMTSGAEKEFDLTASELQDFLNWYAARSNGTGDAYYIMNKNYNVGPFINRKEYIAYDKIQSFEVKDYNQ